MTTNFEPWSGHIGGEKFQCGKHPEKAWKKFNSLNF